jgi:protein-L-isoaspartate(D-aspartate) O-methyltransferase
VPIAPGRGLSPPASLGRLLNELGPRPGERALVVGAGSGYSAAILATIGCEVVAVESDGALAANLRTLPGVRTIEGPLEEGAPGEGPFDLILVDGLIEELPDALVEQLKVGGRLGACLLEGGVARLMTGTRSVHGFGLKSTADSSMAPLPGFARPRAFTF